MPEQESGRRTPTMAAIPLAIALAAAGFQMTTLQGADGETVTALTTLEVQAEEDFLQGLTEMERSLVAEHAFEGLPATRHVAVRRGYLRGYSPETRGPAWVAYHVTRDYVDVPTRTGRLASFLVDDDVDEHVSDRDFLGLQEARGFDRGHLAPYGVMGGDRNGNGVRAPDDEFDVETIRQANLLSNIVPQHKRFNSGGGVWYELERTIQEDWVADGGKELWIFAGVVVGSSRHEVVGRADDIFVPPAFFKIVVRRPTDPEIADGRDLPKVLAFLLPHHRFAHGEPREYLVTVDVIEALTGLDFFHHLHPDVEAFMEDADTFCNWLLFAPGDADDPDFDKCPKPDLQDEET